jgi:hypothetical protein
MFDLTYVWTLLSLIFEATIIVKYCRIDFVPFTLGSNGVHVCLFIITY